MKKNKQNKKAFDESFDQGEVEIDFSSGFVTEGLGKTIKLPPLDIPSWMHLEISRLAKRQGNNRSSVIRQLLYASLMRRKKSTQNDLGKS